MDHGKDFKQITHLGIYFCKPIAIFIFVTNVLF